MINKRIILTTAIIFISVIVILGLAQHDAVIAAEVDGNKIEALLLDQLAENGSADFVIEFSEQADLLRAYSMDWEERGNFVYNTLRETADRSQLNAKAILEATGFRYQSFFAGNELYVWAGDQATTYGLMALNELASLPEVSFIRATRNYTINPIEQPSSGQNANWMSELLAPKNLTTIIEPTTATIDWGITDTKANQFWTAFGVQGEGVVVASIDTGVQWNHPALDQAYKCSSNPSDLTCWYDPANICGGSPCDNNGHGTHTMGTMVADDDPSLLYIAGMAPAAKWIACKGCETEICSDASLNACADWILAPNGNPANRPDIVNNSWGGEGGDAWFVSKVAAWQAAGIFPAFSSGNTTGCGSMSSPGDYQGSFASTAHNKTRVHAFSSGPSVFGDNPYTKPNLSAPGVDICSSIPTNEWSCRYSGTSMASPHTAGAVALLLSCNSSLKGLVDKTFQLLQNTADLPPTGTCSAPTDGEGNYTFGYGYLNVLSAGETVCGKTLDRWTQITLPSGCPDWTRYDGEYYAGTDRVYFMGGRSGTTIQVTFGDIYAYDPTANSCTNTGVILPQPVSNYTIAKVNNGSTDLLCIFGGRLADGTKSSVVQCYDPLANSAEIAGTLPGDLGLYMASGVAVVNNKVYVFGGFSESATPYHSIQTWEWDPISKNWTRKGDLSTGRGYMDVATADGKIYAFGGDVYDGMNLVAQSITEVFDPASGQWNDDAVADLAKATGEGIAYGFNSTSSYALAGKIILAGGGQWPKGTAEVVQYNIAANNYDFTYAQINITRANQAGFFIPGDPGALWVFGGRSQAAGYGDNDPPYAPPEYSSVNITRPDIVITPSALRVTLFEGQTKTINLTITNKSTSTLDWTLAESSSSVLLNSSSPFIPVEITGSQVNDQITTMSPGVVVPEEVIEPENTGMVLWDQPLSNLNQKGYVNQVFPDYPNYSSFLADDFTNDSVWAITSIVIPGDGWGDFSTLMNATSLTWQIYTDQGGIPAGDPAGGGVPPLWTLTVPPTDTQVVLETGTPGGFLSTTRLQLSTPLTLSPGHYWLVFYPTLQQNPFGQFGRQPADSTNGYVGKFINPGNGFGYGATWQDWGVLETGVQLTDIAFRLEGDLLWLSESPITGTLPAGGSQQVVVTFDSAGMQPSINTAGLVMRTNDIEQPIILIPIRFTVTNGVLYLPQAFKH